MAAMRIPDTMKPIIRPGKEKLPAYSINVTTRFVLLKPNDLSIPNSYVFSCTSEISKAQINLIEINDKNAIMVVKRESIKRKTSPVSAIAYLKGVPIVIFELGGSTD